jgi:hypothetical protein
MGRPKAAKFTTNQGHLLAQVKQAATLLKYVSDPTRLQFIAMLSDGEMYVGAMCCELNLLSTVVPGTNLRHARLTSPV